MDFDILNPTPRHLEIRRTIRAFAEQELDPQAAEHDRNEIFNLVLFHRLGKLGFLGLTVPERFGGSGLDASAAVIAYEELSAVDPGFALSCLAHSILFANSLSRCGNDAQCARFLPDACAGRIIGGMAISEVEGGTDVMSMRLSASLENDRYLLNGAKMWITNALTSDSAQGDVFLVYARTSGHGPRGLSLFLVEKGTPGFSVGARIRARLGVRASPSAELLFKDCQVPVANRIGEEGSAVLHMMRTLEIERLTMAAMGLGIARRAIEIMNRYASERRAFGKPLRDFGQIQRHIGESYAEFSAGRCYVYQTANKMDLAKPSQMLDSEAAKLYCSTMAKTIADRAIQVLGAYGYSGRSPVERLWRDARVLEIGGGTIEAHQKNITSHLRSVDRIQ